MKARELRDLTDGMLRDEIANVRRDVFGLRMQHATGELENTAGLRGRKRAHGGAPARDRLQRDRHDRDGRD
jgi:large subunit ribosomal protein L29